MLLSTDIAKICHEANKVYCELIGDNSQVHWDESPQWQKTSSINGVIHILNNPDASPCDSHNNWLKEKLENGWKYGPIKDVDKKEHPCIVPYEKLPIEQQKKDLLFLSIVKALI